MDIRITDSVVAFDMELPDSVRNEIQELWDEYGGYGKFMICQPQERGSWRLRGRILNPPHFDTIASAIEGEVEKQKYAFRKRKREGEADAC